MAYKKEMQTVSCLRNEKVVIRHIAQENAMIGNNPKHVLSEGMADNAIKRYTVTRLKNGQLRDPLTTEEKDYLEALMGLEPNALSVHRKEKNFWWNYQVTLAKRENVLDLSSPDDYIKYKILLLNDNVIAPSLEALQNKPKATYEFVIIRETEEDESNRKRISSNKEAYMEFGKIEEDWAALRFVAENMSNQSIADDTKLISLQDKVDTLITSNTKLFLKVVKDPMFSTKVLLREAISAGVIANRAGSLFMRDTNTPLCDSGEPTLSVAAAYLNMPKNQELRFLIQNKVKEYKETR